MADNVSVTEGSGVVVAADEIAGVKHQRVKTQWGGDGTANDVNTAAGKALPVQGEATEDAASTGNPVLIGGRYDATDRSLDDGDVGTIAVTEEGHVIVSAARVFAFENTPTVTAGAYSASDCLGGIIEIANAARRSGGGGVISQIVMAIEDNDADGWSASDVDVIIFKSLPGGTYTDNLALAVSDADAFEIEAVVTLDEKFDLGDVTLLQAKNISLPYVCDSTSLWMLAVNRGGKTPEATDAIQFRLKLIRD